MSFLQTDVPETDNAKMINGCSSSPAVDVATKRPPFDTSVFSAGKSVRESHPFVHRFRNEALPRALDVMNSALKTYGRNDLAIAFNGGKDCTVLLDLVLKAVRNASKSSDQKPNASTDLEDLPGQDFLVVYLRSKPQFSSVEDFIQTRVRELSLNLCTYNGDVKESLWKFKNEYPHVKGIFMGTRCKDPFSKHLSSFTPTDPTWPEFMRILPILHFTYHDVWFYLKEFNVPYCKIYDEGYTSVGWEGNTFKNPKLKTISVDGEIIYKPAYLLEDSDDERTSRD